MGLGRHPAGAGTWSTPRRNAISKHAVWKTGRLVAREDFEKLYVRTLDEARLVCA